MQHEFSDLLGYDLKLSYQDLVINPGTYEEIKKAFIDQLIDPLSCIKTIKIKDFDKDKFINEVILFLRTFD